MSIDRRMDKEDVVYIYNGILFSHKKEQTWVSSREVDEPRACEISQKEENKHYILTHVYGAEKNGADEPICRAAIETQT